MAGGISLVPQEGTPSTISLRSLSSSSLPLANLCVHTFDEVGTKARFEATWMLKVAHNKLAESRPPRGLA